MNQFLFKVLVSAVIIVAVSVIAKKSSWMAALLASLPLTSLLALSWLYYDSRSLGEVQSLSKAIFFLAIPSLAFFPILNGFITLGAHFTVSLFGASVSTAFIYWGYWNILKLLGVTGT